MGKTKNTINSGERNDVARNNLWRFLSDGVKFPAECRPDGRECDDRPGAFYERSKIAIDDQNKYFDYLRPIQDVQINGNILITDKYNGYLLIYQHLCTSYVVNYFPQLFYCTNNTSCFLVQTNVTKICFFVHSCLRPTQVGSDTRVFPNNILIVII